ncbi:MAG TPA: hypothetical protein VM782_04300 [Stellaceae bacterium]|nr:hypothetical protein [Stellaceae bacterium]
MTEFERFAEALAKTESSDTEIAWGDPKEPQGSTYDHNLNPARLIPGRNFMACGRWQMHPAWYHDWVPLKVPVDASWDEMFRESLENFWNSGVGVGDDPLHIAMKFHLGVAAVRGGKWDQPYADRFARFYGAKTEES